MKFPILVYRCPGAHQCLGGSFDYLQVVNQQQLKDAVEAGWYPSLPQAIQGGDVKLPELEAEAEAEAEAEDDLPPTRQELEQKAKELGINFNKNTKDETLLQKIEAALED